MPLQCTLFSKAFRNVDPCSIGRFLGNALDLSNRTEGRSVWVHKKRGDGIATAVFALSITQDQIGKLFSGDLEFKAEKIVCEEVKEIESPEPQPADEGSGRPGKRMKTATIEELCLSWKSTPFTQQLSDKRKVVEDTLATALRGVRAQAKTRGYTPRPEWDQLAVEDTLFVSDDKGAADPSPVDGYRNKCEFTFAPNAEGEPDIGFMHTRATLTTEPVVAAGENLMNVPSEIAKIVLSLRNLLRSNIQTFPLFSHRFKTGFWRVVSIRACPITRESQVVIQSGPTEDKKVELENILINWGQECAITSLYVQYNASVTDTIVSSDLHEMKKLLGPTCINMGIGPRARFQVHPLSFFQTNTRGCEILYDRVGQWLDIQEGSVLLDVCCGVGTIGQYVGLSKDTVQVLGVDIVSEAVDNARDNAAVNGISGRASYIAGRAEEVLPGLVARGDVAVVDPPRSGLHKTVIRAIRETEKIKKLVYVSCNPKTLAEDLVKLCEPLTSCPEEEGSAVNHRFIPTKAVAVDMFPNTVHCEVVVLLTRP